MISNNINHKKIVHFNNFNKIKDVIHKNYENIYKNITIVKIKYKKSKKNNLICEYNIITDVMRYNRYVSFITPVEIYSIINFSDFI
jgi:hypothetical protein